jgi:hypothetical protein
VLFFGFGAKREPCQKIKRQRSKILPAQMAITLDALREVINESLAPIITRLDRMDERLDRMDERFDRVEERLDRMDERFDRVEERLDRMDGQFAILSAKQMNSTGTRKSKIQPVGKIVCDEHGKPTFTPFDTKICLPTAMGDLITAGNEKGSGEKNSWNAKKSLQLIQWYDPTYESDDDTESTSRRRRATVAAYLGITATQLNGFQTSLDFE